MTWKTLGESLEAALASMKNEAGEPAATGPVANTSKKRPSRSPAKFQEVVSRDTALRTQEDQVSRKRRIAPSSPRSAEASPKPAMRRFLVIEGGGGGPAQGQGGWPGRLRADAGEGTGRAKLMLVVG